ncbi:MAG: hypothetical protein QNJ17_08710 [Desulfocapsaceae bacterium]|nr:hypothetical protein [Desulfocapsaceae bacterium]
MLLKIVLKRLSHFAGILMILAALTGCEAIRSMDSINGILTKRTHRDPEVEMLNQAETAYFNNNFDLAESLFLKVRQNTKKPGYKNQAHYGLSCIAIITANDMAELRKSFSAISRWQKPEPEVDGYEANPKMLIVALDKKANLLNCETEIKVVTTEKKMAVNKEYQLEIEQLKQTIQKLKHQISVLEAIDQEIQEKRKPI